MKSIVFTFMSFLFAIQSIEGVWMKQITINNNDGEAFQQTYFDFRSIFASK
jgi:hypothetical protein